MKELVAIELVFAMSQNASIFHYSEIDTNNLRILGFVFFYDFCCFFLQKL